MTAEQDEALYAVTAANQRAVADGTALTWGDERFFDDEGDLDGAKPG